MNPDKLAEEVGRELHKGIARTLTKWCVSKGGMIVKLNDKIGNDTRNTYPNVNDIRQGAELSADNCE